MSKPEKNSEPSKRTAIGIVAALNLELAPLLDQLNVRKTVTGNGFKYRNCFLGETRIVVCEGGAGQQRAKDATNAVIDAFDPRWILSIGISGALLDEMKIGQIAVANELVRSDAPGSISIPVGMKPDSARGLFVDRLCTADHIVRTIEEKRELHQQTGAIAVDMESYAVAEAALQRKTLVMVIRSISDTLAEDLPREVLAIFGEKGTIRTGALVGTLFKRPNSVKDLWKIRANAVRAAESLAHFTLGVIPQLAESPALVNEPRP